MADRFPKHLIDKYPSLRPWAQGDMSSQGGGREQALLRFIKEHQNFKDLQGSPAEVLAAIDDFANNQRFLINIGSDKGHIVTDLITEEKPKLLVELGGYIGYSAILFADQMRRTSGEGVKLWSLEYSQEFADIATELIAIAGLSDIVTVVMGPAEESLRKIKADGRVEGIDFLFLDHVEDLYVQDFKVCEELGFLKRGSMIVADNVKTPGAPEYRDHVRSHAGLESWGVRGLIIPGDIEDEMEISRVL